MNIGEASAATGVSSKMIRYYEQIGLIRPATRAMSGYRVYSPEEIHILHFVRKARDMGFTGDQIANLLALWRDRSRASADVKRMALEHVEVLERKIGELQAMSGALRHLAENCHGDERPHCPIIEDLANAGGDHAGHRHLGKGFEVLR